MANKTQEFIDYLRKTNFSNFIEKVFLKNNKFTVLENENIFKNKKQRKIMKDFSAMQKKEMVFLMATLLLIGGTETSNKEIKDELHTLYSGIELGQQEVSDIMTNLFNEGKFVRENKSTSGQYFKYSNVAVDFTTVAIDSTILDAIVTPTKDKVVNAAPITITPTMIAIASTGAKTAVLGPIGAHPVDFLKRLDDNLYIAFTKGKGDYILTDATDKYIARDLFKDKTNAKHNDVRTITLKTYLKRANV